MKDTVGISAIKQLAWIGEDWEIAFGESGFAQTKIDTAEGGKERSLVLPFEEAATLHVNTQSDLEIETCVAANLFCAGPL